MKSSDTKAIQAAFDAAAKKTWSEQPPGSAYFIAIPTVFVPAGKYLITETIDLKANVSGEGTAIVEQQNAEEDVLSSTFAWRLQVSGLTFVGGRHQLYIGNPNVDTGRITIDKCAFYKARGTAIRLRQGSNSTQVSVRDGVFSNCDQALVNWCDLTSVADCWISSAAEMKARAVIENHGVLTLQNICGVPAVKAENDQRWIDNYGTVTARNFRFGGESAGFTAVVNFAPYVYTYPVVGPGIVLDSCDIYALGNPKRKAAIFCEQVPNQIVVRNCRGLCDLPVVRVSDKLDLETYFDNANNVGHACGFSSARRTSRCLTPTGNCRSRCDRTRRTAWWPMPNPRVAIGIAGHSLGTETPKAGGRPADSSKPPRPAIKNRSAGHVSSPASPAHGARFTRTWPRMHQGKSPNDE